MQVLLGSSYVNDFDFNNRSYRVYVQADQQFRAKPEDIERYYVRTADGRMMPLSNVVSVQRGDGAEDHHPLQPVPLGRDQRVGGARLQLGPGAADHGAAVEPRAAAGHDASRGRACRSRRLEAGQQSAAHLRPRPAARLSDAGRAVREPHAAVHHPAVGAARDPGRARRRSGAAA